MCVCDVIELGGSACTRFRRLFGLARVGRQVWFRPKVSGVASRGDGMIIVSLMLFLFWLRQMHGVALALVVSCCRSTHHV